MALSVQNLTCGRGSLPVLADVSFSLSPGEAMALHGPNGSGKTTLLRTIAGLTPAMAGRIEAAPDTLAFSGHADGIKAQLSVTENLRFWSAIFGQSGIDRALDAYDLHELADRRAGSLSAGQKRRLSLARLLVTGRPIWCLDEPTVSLDTRSTSRFAAAVTSHLAGGGIAIMATHIDLGLDAAAFDVTPFRAAPDTSTEFADPFEAPL